MTTALALVTPSYRTDFDLCRELHASVLRQFPADVGHHIIVPRRDVELFSQLRSARCEVWSVDALLPRSIRPMPGLNVWLNVRRPWPPVRGWILQQVVKLAAATVIEAEVLLFVDSDIAFVRPTTVDTFLSSGRLPLYRVPAAVDASLPNHQRWHTTARRLLALPPAPAGPLPDYISPLNAWEGKTARALLAAVEQATGRAWADALCRELHLSEYMLYGVFVDEALDGEPLHVETMRCHNYWDEQPLDQAAAERFLHRMDEDDVAVMISAKSGTPLPVRRYAHAVAGGSQSLPS